MFRHWHRHLRGAHRCSSVIRALLLTAILGAMTACSGLNQLGFAPGANYAGRLALVIQTPQSSTWQARFELQGSAAAGQLTLISPVGTTLALATWDAKRARIQRGQNFNEYDSADAMLNALLGSGIHMDQLWNVLHEKPVQMVGWQTEQEMRGDQGRLIIARRHTPSPALTLKILIQPSVR